MTSPQRALTRTISPSLTECLLTHMDREPIDVELAARQHDDYEQVLRDEGLDVLSLPAEPAMPDSVFVEDTAVVVDELAVITKPARPSRQPETESVAAVLGKYRRLVRIEAPGTLEGGDVLRVGRTVYVGRSTRTNDAGIEQLRDFLGPLGYEVIAVDVGNCLHLKTACTDIGRGILLANPEWADMSAFRGLEVLPVDPGEEFAGNALRVNGTVVMPSSFPRTAAKVEERGFIVRPVDVSELQKAEAGLTCCSVLF